MAALTYGDCDMAWDRNEYVDWVPSLVNLLPYRQFKWALRARSPFRAAADHFFSLLTCMTAARTILNPEHAKGLPEPPPCRGFMVDLRCLRSFSLGYEDR